MNRTGALLVAVLVCAACCACVSSPPQGGVWGIGSTAAERVSLEAGISESCAAASLAGNAGTVPEGEVAAVMRLRCTPAELAAYDRVRAKIVGQPAADGGFPAFIMVLDESASK